MIIVLNEVDINQDDDEANEVHLDMMKVVAIKHRKNTIVLHMECDNFYLNYSPERYEYLLKAFNSCAKIKYGLE